jgi:hypothetical protein
VRADDEGPVGAGADIDRASGHRSAFRNPKFFEWPGYGFGEAGSRLVTQSSSGHSRVTR